MKISFLRMNITVLLTFFCVIQMTASTGFGQEKISFDIVNTPLEDILGLIKDQTDYRFFFEKGVVNLSKRISLKVSDETVENVLSQIFRDSPIEFTILKDQVVLTRKSPKKLQPLPNLTEEIRPHSFSSKLLEEKPQNSFLITGIVTDRVGEPLIGVNILVKETTRGTVTNFEGKFSIAVETDNVLVFSYVGYRTQEVVVGSNPELSVVLIEDAKTLEELVVVGYGMQKKSDLTGSIASIPKERLEATANINISQAIQGAVSGVLIQTNTAGAAPSESLMIRGRNSINAGNTPLIVVDGISYNGNISDINLADVESIEILKDASSAAIYGARGANGVILISTKKGTHGQPVVSYNSHVSFQQFTKLPDVMDGEEFIKYREERFPGVVTQSEREVLESGKSIDWISLGLRKGFSQKHDVSVAGSIGNATYYISGGYLGIKGLVVNDDFKRLTGRLNIDIPITDWISIGTRTQISNDNKSGATPNISSLFYMNPNTTPFDDQGSQTIYPWPEDVYFGNPLAPLLYEDVNTSDQVMSNTYILINVPFINGLSYRFNAAFRKRNSYQSTYRGRNTAAGLESRGSGSLNEGRGYSNVFENILTYDTQFKNHHIIATGVLGSELNKNTSNSISAVGFPNDFLSFYSAAQADASTPSFAFAESVLVSQMLRLNYIYDSRYLITLTGRRDGFSGFGTATKWGVFPSIAVAWNFANERFFPFTDQISMMKLRASYGSNGNNAIGAYQSLSNLRSNDFVHRSETKAGFFPSKLGQENLSWEESKILNLGLDIGVSENRVVGEINYYLTNTYNLLLDRTISSVHGITSIIQNIGETRNQGVEISLHTRNIDKANLSWSTQGNFSFIKNEIVDLYGNGVDDIANSWFIGHPININYDFQVDGVWQLSENDEASAWGSQPGFVKLRDVNKDGRITAAEDKVIIGQRDPKLLWGLTNTLSYKSFSFNLFIHGMHGVTKVNTLKTDNDTYAQVRQNTIKKNWWTPENPTNDFVMNHLDAEIMDGIGGRGGSRIWWYEDAGFVRVKDITVAYQTPQELIRKIGLKRLKIYANLRNQFTITKWEGLDPELSSQLGAPLQKEFIIGLDVSF